MSIVFHILAYGALNAQLPFALIPPDTRKPPLPIAAIAAGPERGGYWDGAYLFLL